MELLGKLPSHLILNYHAAWEGREWDGYIEQHLFDSDSFEEAVIALAERAKQ
jgi:hypothetical protein